VTSADDTLLARRVQARDAEAEAEVCRRFAPRIRRYGLRHLRDAGAADDLVQEVLALTLTRLREGRVEDPDKLGSYVLGCCRLVSRNTLRTGQRRRALLDAYAAEIATATEPTRGGQVPRLAACLGGLSERERTVITLTYYVERTAPEIADELGLSHANVRVIRHRALARLLACMNAKEAP